MHLWLFVLQGRRNRRRDLAAICSVMRRNVWLLLTAPLAGTLLFPAVADAQESKSLRGTKTPTHHASIAWYSWISPPRTSRRSIEGTLSTGVTGREHSGTLRSSPRWGLREL
jgi:hypothetical protein